MLPVANGHAMNEHLAEISRLVAPGAHAVVTLDGAGWHQPGGKLRIPDNISLLPLPPYAPELSPVENVWQFLRQNHLSNRIYDTYDAILDACCNAWNALVADLARITSIATRDWAQVSTQGRWLRLRPWPWRPRIGSVQGCVVVRGQGVEPSKQRVGQTRLLLGGTNTEALQRSVASVP